MGALDLDRAPSASLSLLSPSVRRARPADLPALARLINRAYAVEASFADGERTGAAELAALGDRGHFLVLDGPHGELAAAIHVALDGVHASFGLLAVAPELQRLGLGRRLVALAEALAAAVGCHDVSLSIVNLRTELGPWYRSQGYREIGTAPYEDRPTRRPCHLVRMAKTLSAAAN
ncbi:MAG TPA: GNAT family N-acetyltransferase [Kofleriaceae bacterium]|nr:GNAT family N-acetyltransferase [Kofleriaceae bacterium]